MLTRGQNHFHAIEFREHADKVAVIVNHGRTGNAMLQQFVNGVEHVRVRRKCYEFPRHVVFDER
jgi:hypothetical protein